MNTLQGTKPEPLAAKVNWHYDSYFLSQLERLNLRRPTVSQPSSPAQAKPVKVEIKSADASNGMTEADVDLPKPESDEVIAKIEELAASIGVSVKLIESQQSLETASD